MFNVAGSNQGHSLPVIPIKVLFGLWQGQLPSGAVIATRVAGADEFNFSNNGSGHGAFRLFPLLSHRVTFQYYRNFDSHEDAKDYMTAMRLPVLISEILQPRRVLPLHALVTFTESYPNLKRMVLAGFEAQVTLPPNTTQVSLRV